MGARLRLGSRDGPDAFWALDVAERRNPPEFRVQPSLSRYDISLSRSFITYIDVRAIEAIRYFPDKTALTSLVWDKDSETLYI